MKPMVKKSQEPDELTTTDYDSVAIAAGKISPEGVDVILDAYEVKMGKFGEFLQVVGRWTETDEPVMIMTSSTKLRKLITDRWDYVKGKNINLSGHGDSYERNYLIRLK